jgi:hypothetical protein
MTLSSGAFDFFHVEFEFLPSLGFVSLHFLPQLALPLPPLQVLAQVQVETRIRATPDSEFAFPCQKADVLAFLSE